MAGTEEWNKADSWKGECPRCRSGREHGRHDFPCPICLTQTVSVTMGYKKPYSIPTLKSIHQELRCDNGCGFSSDAFPCPVCGVPIRGKNLYGRYRLIGWPLAIALYPAAFLATLSVVGLLTLIALKSTHVWIFFVAVLLAVPLYKWIHYGLFRLSSEALPSGYSEVFVSFYETNEKPFLDIGRPDLIR